ncbi:hypothetical protein CYMTET_40984 [Cymbomonas tetramitiformis]|uniref:YTH domain-containing protein n=1 Tax=Cymbomonas tetramitiformis TaxID=36881 RepID=A0AAE0F301_9CHLO|nr:hypothetical protein CYMTET_40984 [Cymbomonas tetramitiformis]
MQGGAQATYAQPTVDSTEFTTAAVPQQWPKPETATFREGAVGGGHLVATAAAEGGADRMPSAAQSTSEDPPPGATRYFLIKSSNWENLEMSVKSGVWATNRVNEAKLNDAFATCDNIMLFFSVNESRHFQGCALMRSRVGDPKAAPALNPAWQTAGGGTGHYGHNFLVRWLKLCDLPFTKTHHLYNAYNEGKQVKVGRDTQEMEPTVAAQLVTLLYSEPDGILQAKIQRGLSQPEQRVLETAAPSGDTGFGPGSRPQVPPALGKGGATWAGMEMEMGKGGKGGGRGGVMLHEMPGGYAEMHYSQGQWPWGEGGARPGMKGGWADEKGRKGGKGSVWGKGKGGIAGGGSKGGGHVMGGGPGEWNAMGAEEVYPDMGVSQMAGMRRPWSTEEGMPDPDRSKFARYT